MPDVNLADRESRRPAHGPAARTRVVLVSPYEIGRQPFGLAEPAALLAREGFEVACLDLAQERLRPEVLADADLVALYVAMHTATRIAMEALPRIHALAPRARLAAYGLYAPVNEAAFRARGVEAVLGGEFEPALLEAARRVRDGHPALQAATAVSLARVPFVTPDRDLLPPLSRYARLVMPGGERRVVAFAESSRGCKHLCRHCPVVPVYNGRFRVVPVDVVLDDVAAQVRAGARHVSFGDPDFLNGPTHALRVVRALDETFPALTFDATVKIEHIIAHADLLPEFARRGCLFMTTAVESVDERILALLDKGHTDADFSRAVALLREAGIAMAPTFVAFTPWMDLEGYLRLLSRLVELDLVGAVPPVQLAIRLLVPAGSRLLELPGVGELLEPFDPAMLGHPWRHADPRVDELQQRVQALAMHAEQSGLTREEAFRRIWALAHEAAGRAPPALPADLAGPPAPQLSEPWYCCAEPTEQQLQSF